MKLLYAIPLLAVSSVSFGGDFWADRLGGGPGDVRDKKVSHNKYSDVSTIDVVRPIVGNDSTLIYNIKSDSEATVDFLNTGITRGNVSVRNKSGVQASQFLGAGQTSESSVVDSMRIAQGEWTISIQQPGSSDEGVTGADRRSSAANELPVAVVDFSESNYSLAVSTIDASVINGTEIIYTARVTKNTGRKDKNIRARRAISIQDAAVTVAIESASGRTRTIRLRDSGNVRKHGDNKRGDAIYSARVRLKSPGMSEASITMDGMVNGLPFKRSTVIHSNVSTNRVKAVSKSINATPHEILGQPIEDGRYGLPVSVRVTGGFMPDYLNTRAEVWAKDKNGDNVVVGWIGGIVKPVKVNGKRWAIPFTFHSGWLKYGDYQEPFTVQNIRLTDIDSGDQLLHSGNSVGISGIEVPLQTRTNRTQQATEPTIAMQKGIHPSELSGGVDGRMNRSSQTNANPFVVSLHGWCDSGKSVSHFSSAVRGKAFVYGGSRHGETSERYAVDVMNWLGWRPGFVRGIVAHSQGGLVAATLLQNFSYVFADNARSLPPNVVSMGSPYYGASLLNHASNDILKFLVKIFGSSAPSCAKPYELYRSQNQRWRDKIGTRAQTQISAWYTTHTRSRWYDPRDCGSSSYIIRHHDDGVIRVADGLGFADGGNHNRSRSGYCHSSGLGQGDQWLYPDFVTQVNNLFWARQEAWQPF